QSPVADVELDCASVTKAMFLCARLLSSTTDAVFRGRSPVMLDQATRQACPAGRLLAAGVQLNVVVRLVPGGQPPAGTVSVLQGMVGLGGRGNGIEADGGLHPRQTL